MLLSHVESVLLSLQQRAAGRVGVCVWHRPRNHYRVDLLPEGQLSLRRSQPLSEVHCFAQVNTTPQLTQALTSQAGVQ